MQKMLVKSALRFSTFLLQGQLCTFPSVVVLVAVLVLRFPLAKRHYKHPKGLVLGPEPMLNTRPNKKLVIGTGMMDLPIQCQTGTVIKEVKKLVSKLVRMEAGPPARPYIRQINRAELVAHHHLDMAPGPLRFDGLLSVPWIRFVHNRCPQSEFFTAYSGIVRNFQTVTILGHGRPISRTNSVILRLVSQSKLQPGRARVNREYRMRPVAAINARF